MTDEELALYEQRLAEKSAGLLRTLDIFCPENLRPDPPLEWTLPPIARSGTAVVPASKSRAHRLLICAALFGKPCVLRCAGISRDIEATVACLNALGADICVEGDRIAVRAVITRKPADPSPSPSSSSEVSGPELAAASEDFSPIFAASPSEASPVESPAISASDPELPDAASLLPCGESGSTLRFLLPVVGALGVPAVFQMEGRLPDRPLQPLWDLLVNHGMALRKEGGLLYCSGRLSPGVYEIPGDISSQYVSGLLFALPLLSGHSTLSVSGAVESADYIAMTEDALSLFRVPFEKEGFRYRLGGQAVSPPAEADFTVESDWSSAAFFLCLGALCRKGVSIRGLNLLSRQGDKKVLDLLAAFGARVTVSEDDVLVRRKKLRGVEIDASAIPDLIPVLSVVASVAEGRTVIRHAERLRLKESDRLKTTAALLSGLGANVRETEDGLVIDGVPSLRGGTVSSANDHRIAMSAAVASAVCDHPVTLQNPDCVSKSFPGFWQIFSAL